MSTDSRTLDPLAAPQPLPRPALASLPVWLRWVRVCLLFTAIAACALWLLKLVERVEVAGMGVVDMTRASMDQGPGWVDPRWEDELRAALAEFKAVPAEDAQALAMVVDRVSKLPFVDSVGEPRVLWPDGLALEIRLREPVACLSVDGRQFLPLCADGTLLSGIWPSPPARGSGFLPVVVPGDPTLGARAFPGARLVDKALGDALSIAQTLWGNLKAEDLARLGRIVIDARKARQTSVEEPGALLLLEGSRVISFGRSPNLGEPGELPVELKWRQIARALALLDPQAAAQLGLEPADWQHLDVRWDRGGMSPARK